MGSTLEMQGHLYFYVLSFLVLKGVLFCHLLFLTTESLVKVLVI